ncbi:MAG: hypothetical protein J7J82_03355 [Staphylothermus sp.]|nr:hypothetical protein [Staphylothermus sp.]
MSGNLIMAIDRSEDDGRVIARMICEEFLNVYNNHGIYSSGDHCNE